MRDLREFHNPDLTATINGHKLTVKAPKATEGLRLQMVMADPDKATQLNTTEEITKLFRGELGDDGIPSGGLWDEIEEHEISLGEAIHLGTTALLYFGLGEDVATKYWESAVE